MGEKLALLGGAGCVAARSERDVVADGVGVRADGVRGLGGAVVVVEANVGEVGAEARLEVAAGRRIEGAAGSREDVVDDRWCTAAR